MAATRSSPHCTERWRFAGCTPLVRFPVAALTDGAHVRGDVIGQLGYGANPLDLFTFTDGLVTISM